MIPEKNPFLTMQEKKIAERVANNLVRGIPRVAPTISTSSAEEIAESSLSVAGNIDDLLSQSVRDGASDLHLSCGSAPRYRVDGDLISMPDRPVVTDDWLSKQIQKIAPERLWNEFLENGEADMSYTLTGTSRFRVNVFKQRGSIASVFRTIPTQIKTIEELKVPDVLHELVKTKKGLILVTGPTGSGKALRLDTRIPTPAGWTTIGDLNVGDLVIDSQGNPTTVTGMSPINDTPELYKLTLSDGQEIFADKDHQWIVQHNRAEYFSYSLVNSLKLFNLSNLFDNDFLMTLDQIDRFLKEEANFDREFPTKESIEASLNFMDVLPNGSGQYTVYTALYALGMRLNQRFEQSNKSSLVLSTLEMIEFIKCGMTFELSIVKDGSNSTVNVVSIDNVKSDSSDYGAVRCISVDSPDKSYLCADYVVTHNTTTLTAMIDAINNSRQEHIVTIEDPIEFVHTNKQSLVNQREVGTDTLSFGEALKRVLRQDPDVILIGELRDAETISTALTAAETGHLVFGTLHTQSASKTIDRIIDTFPSTQQNQVRSQLSDTLKSVISQMLVKKIGGGRVAATEILINTSAIAANIREGKTSQIYNSISTGSSYGMHTLDSDLKRLVKAGLVDREEVRNLLVDKNFLDNVVSMDATNEWGY